MLVCLMSVWSWCLGPIPLCHPWNECLHTPIHMKSPGYSSHLQSRNQSKWTKVKPLKNHSDQWNTLVPHLELRWKEVVNEPKVQRILCIVPDLPRSVRGLGMGPGGNGWWFQTHFGGPAINSYKSSNDICFNKTVEKLLKVLPENHPSYPMMCHGAHHGSALIGSWSPTTSHRGAHWLPKHVAHEGDASIGCCLSLHMFLSKPTKRIEMEHVGYLLCHLYWHF